MSLVKVKNSLFRCLKKKPQSGSISKRTKLTDEEKQDKIKERNKKWYNNNRETIKEKANLRYKKKKENENLDFKEFLNFYFMLIPRIFEALIGRVYIALLLLLNLHNDYNKPIFSFHHKFLHILNHSP